MFGYNYSDKTLLITATYMSTKPLNRRFSLKKIYAKSYELNIHFNGYEI